VGIIDGSGESLDDLVSIWNTVLINYGVLEELDRTSAAGGTDAVARAKRHAEAVTAAVVALRKLTSQKAQSLLRKFELLYNGSQRCTLEVGHEEQLLSNFSPSFWSHCFIHLFCRGDCAERDRRRSLGPYHNDLGQWGKKWAHCLVRRADFSGWRLSVDFIASLYNILLRRDQMRAVQVEACKLTARDAAMLSTISATDLVNAALTTGDCQTIRALLKKDGLDAALKSTFRHLQTAQRNVRSSEASKTSLQHKFTAVRLWSGCSSIFFTLNPFARQPLTIALCNGPHFHVEDFSLDLSDIEMKEFYDGVRRSRPHLLHEAAVENPVAGMLLSDHAYIYMSYFFEIVDLLVRQVM
jgi:hypothetical protein